MSPAESHHRKDTISQSDRCQLDEVIHFQYGAPEWETQYVISQYVVTKKTLFKYFSNDLHLKDKADHILFCFPVPFVIKV